MQTYSDLQTAIQTWISRPGDTNLIGNTADIVALCEDMIAYGYEDDQVKTQPLRIRAMETSVTVVISAPLMNNGVGGTGNAIALTPQMAISSYTNGLLYQFIALSNNTGAVTVAVSGLPATSLVKGSARSSLAGNEMIAGGTYNIYYDGIAGVWVLMPEVGHVPLPNNYLALRSWYYMWQPSITKSLTYFTPQQLNDTTGVIFTGPPKNYTIEADAIRFAPTPDSTYYAPMLYYQKFPALAVAGTNWLMQNAPRIYLFGSLMWAKILMQDDAGALRYMRLYNGACNALQGQDALDRHSGTTLTISNLTGNP